VLNIRLDDLRDVSASAVGHVCTALALLPEPRGKEAQRAHCEKL
jgi:hypothetical protein